MKAKMGTEMKELFARLKKAKKTHEKLLYKRDQEARIRVWLMSETGLVLRSVGNGRYRADDPESFGLTSPTYTLEQFEDLILKLKYL